MKTQHAMRSATEEKQHDRRDHRARSAPQRRKCCSLLNFFRLERERKHIRQLYISVIERQCARSGPEQRQRVQLREISWRWRTYSSEFGEHGCHTDLPVQQLSCSTPLETERSPSGRSIIPTDSVLELRAWASQAISCKAGAVLGKQTSSWPSLHKTDSFSTGSGLDRKKTAGRCQETYGVGTHSAAFA